MEDELNIEGLTIAPGVIETIVSLVISQVDGVATVGGPKISSGIKSAFSRKPSTQGIDLIVEDGQISVEVRVQIYYGYRLPDVAAEIRSVTADALKSQVGIDVNAVDVFIDGVQFAE